MVVAELPVSLFEPGPVVVSPALIVVPEDVEVPDDVDVPEDVEAPEDVEVVAPSDSAPPVAVVSCWVAELSPDVVEVVVPGGPLLEPLL